jgi:hypothetical protein
MTLDIQKEDGEVEQYYKNTDPVGDGRYIECFDSLERMIKDFQSEFVTPNTKVFEGWLNMYHSAGEYWIQGSLDDFNIDDILYSLDGKKIRIEVIEEMKED